MLSEIASWDGMISRIRDALRRSRKDADAWHRHTVALLSLLSHELFLRSSSTKKTDDQFTSSPAQVLWGP